MDLREYLFKKKLNVTEFARKINYGRTYVNAIVTGNRIPGKKLAEAIEQATNGEIKAENLLKGDE
jgi:transcriptional regulator with XRE-family HTH domain